MMWYPMRLEPAVFELVWGGRRLIQEYGMQTQARNAAEAWVLSAHAQGRNTIQNGSFAKMSLAEFYRLYPEICGTKGADFSDFPLLIKLIDAKEDLSVQVHPDDGYCLRKGAGAGKTEAWYILNCAENARLILGFREKLTLEQFEEAIRQDSLMDYVQKIPVKPGDFFFIPAGTLHAICGGILLAEVQQNSNTTYRVYDYNRLGLDGKPRELHIADALAVTRREPYALSGQTEREACQTAEYSRATLVACPWFRVWTVDIKTTYAAVAAEDSFVSLLVLGGTGTLHHRGKTLPLDKGESFFLPANCGEFIIEGQTKILETRL